MDRETAEKMHGGGLYMPTDGDLLEEQAVCLDLLYDYNHLKPSRGEEKRALLEKMFAEIGEGCYIETPFYANFNLTMVDDTHIYVGDHTMIGPNVIIATGGHPVLPSLREQEYQFNMPVHVGRNCWIGAGAILLPGVTVGDNTVIGAGSVVTKDIPADVVAAGNPCRVMRPIGERDREFYFRDRRIDPGLL